MDPLKQLDWNTIPQLWALLTEKNVSRAARRLGISQPAASAALARLRRHFDDELLVRRGQAYTLSPEGERLLPLVTEAVMMGRAVTESNTTFDPTTATREFVIASTDYGQHVVAPMLIGLANAEAPGIRFTFRWPYPLGPTREEILANVDGWIAPRGMADETPHSGLLEDRWVCVADLDHPQVGDVLTLDDVASLPWVLPNIPTKGPLPQMRGLHASGITPRVEVLTDTFSTIPSLVAGTSRLGIIQERLGRKLASATGVRLLDCPWPMPPAHFTLWSRRELESDPAHAWLRDAFARAVEPPASS